VEHITRQSKEKTEPVPQGEKRAFRRIPVNIYAKFFHGHMFYSGIVRNLSDRGMFIYTRKYVPLNSMFVVVIREEKDLLNIIVKVKRIEKNPDDSCGMGVELVMPSSGYLDFVRSV